jgi:mannose-6-phosphate isomerase-like protein (cupin superfamily)
LRKDQKDTQTTHSLDELYYVIEGEGYILVNQKNHRISKGTTIFVPAYTEHTFHGNHGDLIVLYVFARG